MSIMTIMNGWAYYPVFAGTVISIVGWLAFVRREHDGANPGTLSELAARKRESTRYFRLILWVCGPLFWLTGIFFISHRLHAMLFAVLVSLMVGLEMLVGVFPPVDKRQKMIHEIVAYAMALTMMASGIVLAFRLPQFGWVEWVLVGLMLGCAIGALQRRKAFIFYELGFIFISHITLVVAAVELAN